MDNIIGQLMDEWYLLLEDYVSTYEDYIETGNDTYVCEMLEVFEHIEYMIHYFGGELPTDYDDFEDNEDDVCGCTQCKCGSWIYDDGKATSFSS